MITIKKTGLIIKSNGSIGVDKNIFYSRYDIKNIIEKMNNSSMYPK